MGMNRPGVGLPYMDSSNDFKDVTPSQIKWNGPWMSSISNRYSAK